MSYRPARNFSIAALLAVLILLAATDSVQAQSPKSSPHHSHSAEAIPTPAETPTPAPSLSSAAEVAPTKASSNAKGAAAPAAVSTIETSDIQDFDKQPEPIRQLLTAALELTKKNLTYQYGSADPANGGMDCSGTMNYLLKSQGFNDVPRDASEQYAWARHKSRVYPVLSKKQENFELDELHPGDLMFWTGTYNIERDPPVTHTMLYLGRRKSDGHRLMFGASDGRPYDGQRRKGVSVFDSRMPPAKAADSADAATAATPDHAPDFAGYGPIPGIADLSDAASRQTIAAHEKIDVGDDAEKPEKKSAKTVKIKSSPSPTATPHRTHRAPKSDD